MTTDDPRPGAPKKDRESESIEADSTPSATFPPAGQEAAPKSDPDRSQSATDEGQGGSGNLGAELSEPRELDQEASASPPPSDDSGRAVPPPTRAELPAFSDEAWGQTARAVVLFVLLGMALVVLIHLSIADDWLFDFLRRNEMKMDERMMLIYQMIAAGGVLGLACVVRVLFSKRGPEEAASWERWAWFLSPLILLPAVPVVLEHRVWRGRHEEFLPILLFGGMIAEFFFLRAYARVPQGVSRLVAYLFGPDPEPESKDAPPFWEKAIAFIEKHGALMTVVAAALAYGAFMSFYTIRWHHKLGTATFDLGINNNLLFGGLHGKFNQSPVIFPEDPQKYLANHVKLGLYSFLPIYALYPKAETLLSIQSVSLGLGAIPLFLFARKRIPAWWAAALSLCYLAYYPMHGANFYEMKIVPTTAAIVLCCIWAIDAKRWVVGGVTFVWALVMREDVPVPLVVVGGVFLLSGHRPIAGALMAGLGTMWFVLLRFRFMNEVGSWWFPNMYEDLWAEPERGFQGVIKTLLSNPTYTLKQIFVEKKFWYLMHMLVPMMFLPLRRWYGWAALVPGAILTLLVTDYAPPMLFSFQYVMYWSPYLFIAAAVVLGSIASIPGGHERGLSAVTAMCLVSAALTYNYGAFSRRDGYLKSGYHKIEFSFSEEEAKTYEQVKKLVASIPTEATVGATEHIGAHLSSRIGFYTLRRGAHGVEYMVACKKGLKLDRTERTVSEGVTSGEYGVVGQFGDYVVFKRGADTKDNAEIIKKWHLEPSGGSRRSRKDKDDRRDKDDDDDQTHDDDDRTDDDDDRRKKEERDREDRVNGTAPGSQATPTKQAPHKPEVVPTLD